MQRNTLRSAIAVQVTALVSATVSHGAGQTTASPGRRAQPPRSVRMYVFDCGTLHIADTGWFGLKTEEVATSDLAVACFLIAHPKGTLIWDTGTVADAAWKPNGTAQHIAFPDVTMIKSLKTQLAEVGYSPADITYLGLSHYHFDHTANANDFAGATWLVRQNERDAMFAEKPPDVD